MPAWLQKTTLQALTRSELTTSKLQLLFAYRLAFDPRKLRPPPDLGTHGVVVRADTPTPPSARRPRHFGVSRNQILRLSLISQARTRFPFCDHATPKPSAAPRRRPPPCGVAHQQPSSSTAADDCSA